MSVQYVRSERSGRTKDTEEGIRQPVAAVEVVRGKNEKLSGILSNRTVIEVQIQT
jgi:hypothetical protein